MRKCWRRWRRADYLGAVALAVRDERALAPTLASLADEDPTLAPILRELAERSRRGEPLPQALRRTGLLDGVEAAALAGVRDARQLAARLQRLALQPSGSNGEPVVLRWLPLLMGCAQVLPVALLILLMQILGARRVDEVLAPLALQPDMGTGWNLLLAVVIALAGLAVITRLSEGARWLHWLRLPLSADVRRAARLTVLLAAARHGPALIERRSGWRRLLGRTGLLAQSSERPPWWQHWREWAALCRFRGRPGPTLTAAGGDLATALCGLGVVPFDADGRPDWDRAEELADEELQAARRRVWPIWLLLLVGTGVAALIEVILNIGIRDMFYGYWGRPPPTRGLLFGTLPAEGVPVVVGDMLVRALGPLAALWGLDLLWQAWRSWLPQRGLVRLIAPRILEQLRRRRPVHEALPALTILARPVQARRLRRLALSCEVQGEADLFRRMGRAGIIPSDAAVAFQRAAGCSAAALERLWGLWAPSRLDLVADGWRSAIAWTSAMAVMLLAVFVYAIGGVVPKFHHMMERLDGPLPWSLELLVAFRHWVLEHWHLLVLLCPVLLVGLVWVTWRGRWPWQLAARRLRQARLTQWAVQEGLPERSIAALLGRTASDLPTLLCGVGLRGADATAVGQSLLRLETRHHRRRLLGLMAFRLIVPILVAVPLIALAHAVVQTQADFLQHLFHQIDPEATHAQR